MHCELINKDVQVELWKEIKNPKEEIEKTVYKCSECYPEIKGSGGRKMFVYCGKMSDPKCLLKNM